ncbi:MAG: hypothetical protein JRJ12_00085 [Deltaproteobacteria bacterium]|nr:hypothetical protein [Deltaproteobacteria bacterium]MBW2069762.1 hypothetical protein [Deltaproteobacteria bacterium]
MAVFLGGIIAAVVGVILLIVWWVPFLQLLAGALPVTLLLGGAVAAYLGFDEVKDKLPYFGKKQEEAAPTVDTDDSSKYKEEAEKYKAEAEKLKSELEEMKKAEDKA